jgi:hypothetical protein
MLFHWAHAHNTELDIGFINYCKKVTLQVNTDQIIFFSPSVTVVTLPIVVVVCGSHVAVDSSLLLHDAASLGPSTWHTNETLSAKPLRMGLGTWWTRQNTCFVPKSPLANNFETNTFQMQTQLRNFTLHCVSKPN